MHILLISEERVIEEFAVWRLSIHEDARRNTFAASHGLYRRGAGRRFIEGSKSRIARAMAHYVRMKSAQCQPSITYTVHRYLAGLCLEMQSWLKHHRQSRSHQSHSFNPKFFISATTALGISTMARPFRGGSSDQRKTR